MIRLACEVVKATEDQFLSRDVPPTANILIHANTATF
jgi:hypothetical protein